MTTTRRIQCKWEGHAITLQVDEDGSGSSLVLLPALSSISTRAEMRPLLELLARAFHVTAVDWPGFGDLPRPRANWTPDTLSTFLNWFLNEISPRTHAVIAAGHAATYALYQAVNRPNTIGRLVLIAPTWRGPLPTMMGAYRPWFARARKTVDLPIIGQLLYRLNVSRFVVAKMAREHVYSDPNWLSGDSLRSKLAVTRCQGARHASVRFVTGGFDLVASREAFLDLVRRANIPTLVIFGDETPPKSRAEMEALAQLTSVTIRRLPRGKLAIHEEFPDLVASSIESFLAS
jgi:pimeloyl-ACP methyl ester carboxylesterase